MNRVDHHRRRRRKTHVYLGTILSTDRSSLALSLALSDHRSHSNEKQLTNIVVRLKYIQTYIHIPRSVHSSRFLSLSLSRSLSFRVFVRCAWFLNIHIRILFHLADLLYLSCETVRMTNSDETTETTTNGSETSVHTMHANTKSLVDDPNWKEKLKLPPKDNRPKTSDVTATKGHNFEDYCLKRELLMGKHE